MTAAADRHLLFGLLALQNGLIDQGQLMLAFQAWTRDKSKSLGDHLEARGDLTAAKRAVLDALAEVHLEAHDGDVEKSLAAVPANRSTRASLVDLGEPEIEATLARVARSKDGHSTEHDDDNDPDRTATLSLGAATSDGQRFRLLRPHARGGLGEVFVALDAELHREVALKQILEKHADDPVSRQRFLAEAEITGGLEHPGVVPVYGLGTYGSGRPYYAMRFIRGDSLKEAIGRFHADDTLKSDPGRRSLELRKLLRRFLDVCNAVDYAHSRGVIHRDIKPANIILGKHGETLVVDWGLAKVVGRADPSAGEQTIAPSSSGSSETLPGSALGTPAYMSPEQAAGDLDRLGPRFDVYSLGATLYCLLTGKPPFEGDDVGETLRKVQLGEFPALREVNPTLDRALEAICTKAMATKPADRYATCRALAEDLERWAADEPVMAYPEPWTRTLVRWLTRHRTGVTGVAAAVLAGVVGLSVVLVVQTQANAQLSASLKRETKAKLDLAAANANLSEEHAKVEARNRELADERAKVQARYELATDAIKTFHTGVSEDFLLKEEKFKHLRNTLLTSASDFYGKLGALLGKETDLTSRRALAQANFELSDLTDKVGRKEDALQAHRAALAAREVLAAEPGANVETRVDVGRSLTAVAGLLSTTGKTDEAEATYRKAETLLADLARSSPSTPAARAALATCRTEMGRFRYTTGKYTDALVSYRLARDDQEALADAPGASKEARRDLASTIVGTALVLKDTDKKSEAEAEYRKAIALWQKLADDYPAVTQFRFELAGSHTGFGNLLNDTGRQSESEAEYRKAIALNQKLADDNPAVTQFRYLLAIERSNLALALSGKPSEAETELRKAIELSQKLADDNPAVIGFRALLANSHVNLGTLLFGTGKPTEAEAAFRAAVTILGKVVDDDPKVLFHREVLAVGLNNFGRFLLKLGRPAEALDAYGRAFTLAEQLIKENPADKDYPTHRGRSLVGRGLARRALGDPAGAAADVRHALRLSEGLRLPEGYAAFTIACSHAALAGLAGQEGTGVSAAEGEAHADQAMALLRKAVDGYHAVALKDYRTEGALDPLREREDFKKLLTELEQKSAAKPK